MKCQMFFSTNAAAVILAKDDVEINLNFVEKSITIITMIFKNVCKFLINLNDIRV